MEANQEIRKELIVSAIENGTVIDHLPPASIFRVIRILNLDETNEPVYFGTNLDSKKYGKKGIIKVANHYFDKEAINKIALIAPSATIIEIENYKVIYKAQVHIPDEVVKFVKCFNPNCITNKEKVTTHFSVIDKEELKLQCRYCEKITARRNMEFI